MAAGTASAETALAALEAYHEIARPTRPFMRDHYACILEERPWIRCPCAVCQQAGVEVAIFRGNNRNRRRGFHNTFVFYELLGRALNGEEADLTRAVDLAPLPLFR